MNNKKDTLINFKEFLLEKKKKTKKRKQKRKSPYLFPVGIGYYNTFPSETGAMDSTGVD